jgi:hypothetical protein
LIPQLFALLVLHASQTTVIDPVAASLKFELTAPAATIVRGTYLILEARLTNLGSKAVEVYPLFDPMYGFASYTLSEGDGQGFVPLLSFDGLPTAESLEPGATITGDVPLYLGATGYAFKAGNYQIRGVFRGFPDVPGQLRSGILSNAVKLSVTEASPGTALERLANFEAEGKTALFFLVRSGRSFGDLPIRLASLAVEARAEGPSQLTQDAFTVLGDYSLQFGLSLEATQQAEVLRSALRYFQLAEEVPSPTASFSPFLIRLHGGKARAFGALGDRDNLIRERDFLLGLRSDTRVPFEIEHMNRVLDTLEERSLPLDFSPLRDELRTLCNDDDFSIEADRVTVTGPKRVLAGNPAIRVKTSAALTPHRLEQGEFDVGLEPLAGVFVKSRAPLIRIRSTTRQTYLKLNPALLFQPPDTPLAVDSRAQSAAARVSELSARLTFKLPCFVGTPSSEQLDFHPDPLALQWDGKFALSFDLHPTLPKNLRAYGKVTGEATLIPPR